VTDLFGVYELLAQSGLFDAEYYLRANPDIAHLNIDPLTHYLERGAAELRNPSREFDARHYARQCRERGEPVENPLLHYIKFGAAQGLTPRPQKGTAARASGRRGGASTPSKDAETGRPSPPQRADRELHHFSDRVEVTTDGRIAITGWAVGLRQPQASRCCWMAKRSGRPRPASRGSTSVVSFPTSLMRVGLGFPSDIASPRSAPGSTWSPFATGQGAMRLTLCCPCARSQRAAAMPRRIRRRSRGRGPAAEH